MRGGGDSHAFLRQGGELRLSNLVQLELMRAVLSLGARFRFRAQGGSMVPFIKPDDVLTVAPVTEEALRPGRIVAFVDAAGQRLLVHRIIGADKKNGTVLIRGDNCSEPDGVIPRDVVLGVVVRIERKGRDIPLGLGLTGRLIAWLSAKGWLIPAIRWLLVLRRRLSGSTADYADGHR